MTAAGNMNSIHQENHLSYLLLVASEPVHDRERVPVPYSDQLLLLLRNHNQESPTGLNELYWIAMRIDFTSVFDIDWFLVPLSEHNLVDDHLGLRSSHI